MPRIHGALSAGLLFLAACAVPPDPQGPPETVVDAVAARDVAPRVALSALEEAGLLPLFARPTGPEPTRDSSAWWRERAIAWNPEVRRMRRAFTAARAAARGAGSPEAIGVTLENANMPGDGAENDVMTTFDILGIVGVGKSAAAEDLAHAEVRAAWAALEEAVWQAVRGVERTTHELEIAVAQERHLTALIDDCRATLARARGAFAKGWIAPAMMARTEALVEEIDNERSMVRVQVAERRARLAIEAGLPPDETDTATVDPPSWTPEEQPEVLPPVPTPKELLERVPQLRRLLAEYRMADAAVAAAAAESIPDLMIGPRVIFEPMSTLYGIVAETAIAWPGRVRADLDAAVEWRARAREALEDGLLAVHHEARARRHATEILHAQVNRSLPKRERETDRWFIAATGAFAADLMRLEDALMAIEARMKLTASAAALRLELAHSHSALDEAFGPPLPPVNEELKP